MTDVINTIETELKLTFDEIFKWFEIGNDLMHYSPNNGCSIRKILEHISLTNDNLLTSICKGTIKSVQKSNRTGHTSHWVDCEMDMARVKVIEPQKMFRFASSSGALVEALRRHMESKKPVADIYLQLQKQLKECTNFLNQLQHGEGVLQNQADVYHNLNFLVQHAKKHITQMEWVEIEFNLGI